MNDRSISGTWVPVESRMLEKMEGISIVPGLTASDLRVSLESNYGIQKIRIDHGSSRSLLLGFMGTSPEMASRFERILFWKLAAGIRKIGTPTGYINKIEVPDRWQGQGIGSSMLREAIRVMTDAGIREVYLDAYPANQERFEDLVDFYERHGFLAAPECADDQIPPPFIMKADLGN